MQLGIKNRLINLWELVGSSFWFVPALMMLGAIILAFVSVQLDQSFGQNWARGVGVLWAGSPEGARKLLSTLAGSMGTVAGVVFSITIVALTMAASQFGPRLLRNFMRDTGNQIVLGTFVSTFVYCLVVLRTVHGGGEDAGQAFVPNLAVASVGVLIYFIHHVASSLQAEQLIASVGCELQATIATLFPERLGWPGKAGHDEPGRLPQHFEREAREIRLSRDGYLQTVENDGLMDIAGSHDLILKLLRRPGDFIAQGSVVLLAWPRERCDDQCAARLRQAFVQGRHRTATQDPEYGAHQLLQIALRALSPGINDPFTAINCIDWLGAALAQLAQRHIPSPYRYDQKEALRVVAPNISFPDFADVAFNQIRQSGGGNMAVVLRLLETIAFVADRVERRQDRAALALHATMIEGEARRQTQNQEDRAKIERLYATAMAALFPAKPQPEVMDGRGSSASDQA